MTYRVVLTDFIRDDCAPERKILEGLAEVSALGARSEAELLRRIEEVEDVDAIILFHEMLMRPAILDRLRRCKLIVRAGVGYDNIDCRHARSLGIPVANVPDYGSEEVADTALAMALSLARGVHFLNSRLRAGEGLWSYLQVVPLARLRRQSFGIVGLGRIGTAAALRAKAFGMEVLFYDPYKPDGYDKALGIVRCERLEELLERSSIVSLHCPATPETFHLIDAAAIARMPRGAYLVNTARGPVIETAAVPPALVSGQLAGAGIDVYENEPPGPDDPLLAAWRDPAHPAHHRLILNPHSAFYSEQGLLDMRTKAAEACRRAFLGLPLRNLVN